MQNDYVRFVCVECGASDEDQDGEGECQNCGGTEFEEVGG